MAAFIAFYPVPPAKQAWRLKPKTMCSPILNLWQKPAAQVKSGQSAAQTYKPPPAQAGV
jgi:hypothetical protein